MVSHQNFESLKALVYAETLGGVGHGLKKGNSTSLLYSKTISLSVVEEDWNQP
jgi:hypothetical protein